MFRNVFYLYIFSEVSQIQELIPVLAKIHIFRFLILILLFDLLTNPEKKKILSDNLKQPQSIVLIFLSIWMILSVPFSVYPGGSVDFLSQVYWKLIISYVIVVSYVATIIDVKKVIWSYILGTASLCVWIVFAIADSRYPTLYSLDENELGAHLCVAFSFVFWMLFTTQKYYRFLLIIISLVILFVVVKTQSRGAFLGFLGLTFLYIAQIKSLYGKVPIKRLLLTLLFVGVVAYNFVGAEYVDRMTSMITDEDYNITSESGRLAVWGRGLNMIADSPIFGVGVNSFITADSLYSSDRSGKWSAAHNTFIQVGAELGIPGLLMFLYLIYSTLKKLKEISSSEKSEDENSFRKFAALALIGSIWAYSITGFFLSLAYSSLFFILLSFATSFITIDSREKSGKCLSKVMSDST